MDLGYLDSYMPEAVLYAIIDECWKQDTLFFVMQQDKINVGNYWKWIILSFPVVLKEI